MRQTTPLIQFVFVPPITSVCVCIRNCQQVQAPAPVTVAILDEGKAESAPCSDNKSECEEVQQHADSDNKSECEEAQQQPCSDNKSEREEVQQHAYSGGSDNETESDGESDCPADCEEEESDDDCDDDSKDTRTFAQLVQPLSETERANLNNACNMLVHIQKVPGDKGTGKLQL